MITHCSNFPLYHCLVLNLHGLVYLFGVQEQKCTLFSRFTIGLNALQLPMRVVNMVLFFFLMTMGMSLFLFVPSPWATGITMAFWPLVIYLMSMYSALGCMIIDTGAMGSCKVRETSNTNLMGPYELNVELWKQCGTFKGKGNANKTSVLFGRITSKIYLGFGGWLELGG
jgi:hypothetical protein